MIKLWFVRWDDECGQNQDLLVEAETPEHAIVMWRGEFELDAGQMPEYVGEVKLTGKPGIIHWDSISP
jgi:hypothetical protein